MVLLIVLFDRFVFQNLICNGLVLVEDGKKMSKWFNNYLFLIDIINEYGVVSGFFFYILLVYIFELYIFVEVCFIFIDLF